MQTFLPYPDFTASAQSLDMRRLGKQRVEAYQILRCLVGLSKGWIHHPATKMWRGHEMTLYLYAKAVCREWTLRGYKDSIDSKLDNELFSLIPESTTPRWLGNEDFHRSHRANLVAKNQSFYVPKFGEVPFEPYIWPEGRVTVVP